MIFFCIRFPSRVLQYHTPLAVGTLLGMTTMMSQFMFVLFVVFLAFAEYADSGSLASNDRAMAVFAFFLFLLYVSSRCSSLMREYDACRVTVLRLGWRRMEAGSRCFLAENPFPETSNLSFAYEYGSKVHT